jgi:hypothetical protein
MTLVFASTVLPLGATWAMLLGLAASGIAVSMSMARTARASSCPKGSALSASSRRSQGRAGCLGAEHQRQPIATNRQEHPVKHPFVRIAAATL